MPEILYFSYFGPSRRADQRVVEIRLDFGREQNDLFPIRVSDIRMQLLNAGILKGSESYFDQAPGASETMSKLSLLAQTALMFQQRNGHHVSFSSVTRENIDGRYTVLVEHEHSEVGMAAVKLAIEIFTGKAGALTQSYRAFSGFALERALPLETECIINAARRRRIPVFQLEREPLAGQFQTGFRVRPNGLLIVGHGENSHVLDGTFCVDRAGDFLKALLRNPDQRRDLLKQLGLPVMQRGIRELPGSRQFYLLFINRQLFALERLSDGKMQLVEHVHESLVEMCRAIQEKAAYAAIAVELEADDPALPLAAVNGRIRDFDPAPDLGQLLGKCEEVTELMDAAAGELLEWLFDRSETASIPVIAVTGTNGKTTTSRMLSHILQSSGHRPALVCTDGIYVNGRQLTQSDASSFIGHARALTSRQVDAAVLETHHRGIAIRGFAFHQCNVAVCLNVTEEHLHPGEIETLEEMAVIKRALLERASDTAVLFADDERCLAMIEHLRAANICLVSMRSGVEQLSGCVAGGRTSFCVLETLDDEAWIILYQNRARIPVIPVRQIPATFDGAARFNVSNAMHAIAAAYFSGVNIDDVRSAIACFSSDETFTPGRMNEFDGLPFRVIIDFAHNPDGMKNVCEFVGRTKVAGRRIIAFAAAGNRTEVAAANVARAVAGHFDFYFCKDYEPSPGGRIICLAPFIRRILIEEGVPAENTVVITYGREAIYRILDSCQPGDLLMLLLGHVEKASVPGLIREYVSQRRQAGHGK